MKTAYMAERYGNYSLQAESCGRRRDAADFAAERVLFAVRTIDGSVKWR